ncbi:hypothetical protein BD410DRAFT_700379, partial [Rickenella mellea]
EAASWLRRSEVKEVFLRHYDATATMRASGYTIIMEFVPVNFDPVSSIARKEVEKVNGMAEGEILEARYLKDPRRRAPGQQTAFIHMTLRSAKVANHIIREGIIVEGKRVFGRKNLQEPRRCLKCQQYRPNHIAAECKQIHNTCGQCAGMHRTEMCDKPNLRKCSNCRVEGHTASDRTCPVFQRECQRMLRFHPENNYRYFPLMDDPETWELLD